MSKPTEINNHQSNLFSSRLSTQLNPENPLIKLSKVIPWSELEEEFGQYFTTTTGHPPKPIRLMVGLLMLQHMEGLSDEKVVETWVENPYWQFFCGFDYLQWGFPIHPSSLTRWRKKLTPEGIEKILASTIKTSLKLEHTKTEDLTEVIADTTVQEKAITHPTDSKLLHKAREKLVALAKEYGITLRQTYTRVGEKALHQVGRYGHAQQYKGSYYKKRENPA